MRALVRPVSEGFFAACSKLAKCLRGGAAARLLGEHQARLWREGDHLGLGRDPPWADALPAQLQG
jgi:hypothetical protein